MNQQHTARRRYVQTSPRHCAVCVPAYIHTKVLRIMEMYGLTSQDQAIDLVTRGLRPEGSGLPAATFYSPGMGEGSTERKSKPTQSERKS